MKEITPMDFNEIKHRIERNLNEKEGKTNYKIVGDELIIKCSFGCSGEELIVTHIGKGYLNVKSIKSIAIHIDDLIDILKEFKKRLVIDEI